MDKRQLAAQLFLDAINGDNVSPEQARQMAISAWENAGIFDACEPNKPQIGQFVRAKGCRACHGSGGKAASPCKVCSGTGMVAA
jgi:DnaJ-class molecular chaperone